MITGSCCNGALLGAVPTFCRVGRMEPASEQGELSFSCELLLTDDRSVWAEQTLFWICMNHN